MFKKFKRRPKETVSYEFYFFSGSGYIRFSNFWMHRKGYSWRDCARSPNIFSREQRQVSNLQLPKLIWKICREGVNYKSVEAVLKLEERRTCHQSHSVLFRSFPFFPFSLNSKIFCRRFLHHVWTFSFLFASLLPSFQFMTATNLLFKVSIFVLY